MAPTGVPAAEAAAAAAQTQEIIPAETPAAAPAVENITGAETPLAQVEPQQTGHWALLNLILALATVGAAVLMLLSAVKRRRSEVMQEASAEADSEATGTKANRAPFIWRIAGMLVAVVSVIVFFVTENLTLPVALVDKWTLLMAIFLILQFLAVTMMNHAESKNRSAENTAN